jgi:hypothetical protein
LYLGLKTRLKALQNGCKRVRDFFAQCRDFLASARLQPFEVIWKFFETVAAPTRLHWIEKLAIGSIDPFAMQLHPN